MLTPAVDERVPLDDGRDTVEPDDLVNTDPVQFAFGRRRAGRAQEGPEFRGMFKSI